MTYLDPNAVISDPKIKEYLLVWQPKDDKSKFLSQVGYTLNNWQQLKSDLRVQILPLKATPTQQTRYGQKYKIIGNLIGPNNLILSVKTIWMVTNINTKFVTLFPN